MARRFDIVFQGGGARGLVLNGAMEELEELGHRPRRVVGTSAGAIAAVCTAAGYRGRELVAMSREKTSQGHPVFATFLDQRPELTSTGVEASEVFSMVRRGLPEGEFCSAAYERLARFSIQHVARTPGLRLLYDFVESGGFFTGNGFLAWIEEKLEAKGRGWSRFTFDELYAATGNHLSVVAADTTLQRMLVLNHVTAPSCPVAFAARMSMSIPFFFEEVVWRREWGSYMGQDIAGTVVVDGGLVSNFPLRLLLPEAQDEVSPFMGPASDESADILGLTIDGALEVPEAPPPHVSAADRVFGHLARGKVAERIERMVNTALDGNDVTIEALHERYICRLPAKDFGVTEFYMSDARIEALLRAGADALHRHIKGRFPAPKEAAALA